MNSELVAHPNQLRRRGVMLVMSSPSGAGKTTISRALLELEPNLTMSVSATTRQPRPGERDGVDYMFISEETYHQWVEEDAFLEHAKVFDNYYGTPKKPVYEALGKGFDVLFDIDWQGTQQLAQNARADLVSIFILPPSMEELEHRLRGRNLDPEEVVQNRMTKAAGEMSHWREYDYVLINEDVKSSVDRVRSVLMAERQKRDRQIGLDRFVNFMRGVE